jgi:hypothetical protein
MFPLRLCPSASTPELTFGVDASLHTAWAQTAHIPCHRHLHLHSRFACDLECKDTPEVERMANHPLLVRDSSTASTEGISRQIFKERHRLR